MFNSRKTDISSAASDFSEDDLEVSYIAHRKSVNMNILAKRLE